MIGAGLLAKKAVERGLRAKPWVKSSLAPGSKVVTEYYERAGLEQYLDELGFNTVGYGCTTCIGNSGPLPDAISRSGHRGRPRRLRRALRQPQLRGAHPLRGEGELPRVAAARRRVRARRAHGHRPPERADRRRRRRHRLPARHLADVAARSTRRSRTSVDGEMFTRRVRRRLHRRRALARARHARRRALRVGPGLDVRAPPAVLRRHAARAGRRSRTSTARACSSMLGDSVTTDHISPAGAIRPDSPAGKYLVEHGVERRDFNSYGARRGNHEVMVRGTFANVRLRNQLVAGQRGHLDGAPAGRRGDDDLRRSRALPRRRHAADRARGQGVRLGLVARLGGEGAEPARRARRDRRVVRAHPPLEPADDGHPAAAVPRRRDADDRSASPGARSSRSPASRTARRAR